MADTSVKFFTSSMTGAPDVALGAGAFNSVLRACLVTGFGSVTLDSLVVVSNLATATVAEGHNFPMFGTDPYIGAVILIEGATPAGLNGEWRIASATSTEFTFECPGVADGTATGTITAKRAPLGWTEEFSGTNVDVFRSSLDGTGTYLRVDNTDSRIVRPKSYWSMSDVDTGDNASGSPYWRCNNNATAVKWFVIGDGHSFYFFVSGYSDSHQDLYMYGGFAGDLISSAVPDDFYNFMVLGRTADSTTPKNVIGYTDSLYPVFKGAANQIDGPLTGSYLTTFLSTNGSGAAQMPFAFSSLADSGVILANHSFHSNSVYRGALPGVYHTPSKIYTLPDFTTFYDDSARVLLVKGVGYWTGQTTNQGAVVFDLIGPWR